MNDASATRPASISITRAVVYALGVFGVGLAMTALLWARARDGENQVIHQIVVLEAERLSDELHDALTYHAVALRHVADRWATRGRPPQAEWDRDAANLITDMVGFKAIDWVDAQLILRWIAPVQGTRHLIGTRFDQNPVRREAIEQARATHLRSETPVLPLLLGGTGFIIVEPLSVRGRDDGFLLGVLDIERLLNSQIPKKSYHVVLTDERTGASVRTAGDEEWSPAHARGSVMRYGSQTWALEVTPSAKVVSLHRSMLPIFVIAIGFLISLVLGLLVLALAVRNSMNERLQGVIDEVSLYKFALDSTSMVAFKDAQLRFTYVNDKFCEALGYQEHELLGRDHAILDVPSEPLSARPDIRAVLATGRAWHGEISQRSKSGRLVWHDAIVVPRTDDHGRVYQYVTIRRDISTRKQVERQFERMVENLPAGAMLSNSNGLFINKTLEKLTGYTRAEINSWDRWFELIYGVKAAAARAIYDDNVASGFGESTVMAARMKTGEVRHLEFFGGRDGHSEMWVVLDVTEKIVAQERFELMFKHSVDGQLLMEPVGEDLRIVDANLAAVEMVRGKSKADLIGRSPLDFTPPVQRNEVRSAERFEEIKRRISADQVTHFEWERRRLDGTVIPVRVSVSPIRLNGRTIVLSTWHDLTREKAAQAKLVQRSKMLSLGEMAGGLAHEFNTPLATIKGKVQQLDLLAKRGPVPTEILQGGLRKIETTVNRISRIVAGLRTFSGEGDDDPMVVQSVLSVVDDALAFCETRLANQDVSVRVDVAPELDVSCRPLQVTQVILSLLTNAFEAVAGRRHSWIEIQAEAVGDRVEIRVSDSGPGIAKEIRSKIMQPFFTTKEVGAGMGLGLSVAKGIVESHAGTLELDETRSNTCFVLRMNRRNNADAPDGVA